MDAEDSTHSSEWSSYLNDSKVLREAGMSCRGAGEQWVGGTFSSHPRRLSTNALVFVTSGSGEYWDESTGERVPLRAPATIWVPPAVEHAYGPVRTGWREHWVLFEGFMTRAFESTMGWRTHQPVKLARAPQLDAVPDAFRRLRSALAMPDQLSHLVAATIVVQLAGTALEVMGAERGKEVYSVAEKLSISAFRPVSVKERADEIGISPDALQAHMLTETGMSVHDFIINLRIEAAKKLLTETTIPVGLVGSQVGYDDPSYFSRFFQRKVGMPPTQFRSQEKFY